VTGLECHHNTYTFGDATFGDRGYFRHNCTYAMVMVAIHHYKSVLVMNFECHYNTYTFGDATFGDV